MNDEVTGSKPYHFRDMFRDFELCLVTQSE